MQINYNLTINGANLTLTSEQDKQLNAFLGKLLGEKITEKYIPRQKRHYKKSTGKNYAILGRRIWTKEETEKLIDENQNLKAKNIPERERNKHLAQIHGRTPLAIAGRIYSFEKGLIKGYRRTPRILLAGN